MAGRNGSALRRVRPARRSAESDSGRSHLSVPRGPSLKLVNGQCPRMGGAMMSGRSHDQTIECVQAPARTRPMSAGRSPSEDPRRSRRSDWGSPYAVSHVGRLGPSASLAVANRCTKRWQSRGADDTPPPVCWPLRPRRGLVTWRSVVGWRTRRRAARCWSRPQSARRARRVMHARPRTRCVWSPSTPWSGVAGRLS